MKILFVLSRFPYPLMKGDKLRAFHQIKMLSKSNEVHLLALVADPFKSEWSKPLEAYCDSIEIVKLGLFGKGKNLASIFFNSLPIQVNLFKSNKAKQIARKIIESKGIDLVYAQLVRVGEIIPFGLNVHYHLDYMDAMSANMERRFHHSKNYEKRWIKMEKERTKAYEKELAKRFHTLSAISEPDVDVLSKITDRRIEIFPNGVNEDFLSFNEASGKSPADKEYDLIFTGNMGYHPNIVACKYLVNKIKPILEDRGQKVKICLAGTNPSSEVKALASNEVVVTGFVKDLRPYIAASKIFIAPLFSGSGLQNKLLESMALGVPSLTTRLVNNALGAEPGKEIIVCNDMENFSKTIIRLLQNPEAAEELGKAGKDFIKNNFSWETFGEQINEFFNVEIKKLKK